MIASRIVHPVTRVKVPLLLAILAMCLVGLAWIIWFSSSPSKPVAQSLSERPTLTRILFLYGSVPPGTDKGDMIRIGNVGRNGYAQLVDMLYVEQGHNVYELHDTDPVVNPLTLVTLKTYDLLVLGSNNRRFSQGEAAVVRQFVTEGGAVFALSDSRFGLSPNRSQNLLGAGELSDNDLVGQFGFYIEHDNYTVIDATAPRFVDPQHPVLRGLSQFRGEGVSLIRVSGTEADIVVRGDGLLLTDGVTITGPDYAITAVAEVGLGRVAATFDRNTFFNAGVGSDGTDIGQFDNRQYARNLFNWLARPGAPTSQQLSVTSCQSRNR